MIPWLIVIAMVLVAFAVMHFAEGKKQEYKVLLGLFVAVFLVSCVAIYLEAHQGGASGWLKAICFATNMAVLREMDDAKKKKRKKVRNKGAVKKPE